MSLMIELHGAEDLRQVDAVMAALVAYRNTLNGAGDATLRDTMRAHMERQRSGGAEMAARAAEDAASFAQAAATLPAFNGMPRESGPLEVDLTILPTASSSIVGGSDDVIEQARFERAPPVPAAPVSAIPPVPPAPSVADAAASPIAPAVPPAGSVPLPPVPQPPPASPSAPAVAATPAAAGPALDVSGLPWDGRIHSESRATVADGSWRKRRGVDQAVVDAVTAELRALHGQGASPPAPAASSDLTPSNGIAPSAAVPAVPVPPVPTQAELSGVLRPPAPPTNDPFEHFFKNQYLAAMQQGYVVQSGVQQGLKWLEDEHGLANILMIKQHMHLLPAFIEQVPGLAEFVALQRPA